MIEIVEINSRGCQHAEVLIGACVARDFLDQRRIAGLEAPRDEGREAAVLILEGSDRFEMLDDVLGCFDVAVHHGGRRAESERMRFAVHVEPALCEILFVRDLFAYSLGEDLGPAAGEGRLPGVFESAQHFLQRESGHRRHALDLHGAPKMRCDLRVALAHRADELEVIV